MTWHSGQEIRLGLQYILLRDAVSLKTGSNIHTHSRKCVWSICCLLQGGTERITFPNLSWLVTWHITQNRLRTQSLGGLDNWWKHKAEWLLWLGWAARRGISPHIHLLTKAQDRPQPKPKAVKYMYHHFRRGQVLPCVWKLLPLTSGSGAFTPLSLTAQIHSTCCTHGGGGIISSFLLLHWLLSHDYSLVGGLVLNIPISYLNKIG